jgi:HD-GYP domain-containing protein (c-di-GMP phosphodiesterase class II)
MNWQKKSLDKLAKANKELLLIFSIVGFAAIINFLVVGQRLILSFYNLPTLFAAYCYGRKRAVQTAIASALIVTWLNVMNPLAILDPSLGPSHQFLGWMDLVIWAAFLMITAYAMGTLYEAKENRLKQLRETYFGVLQILSHFIGNDKYTQHHSYRVSVYATRIAEQMNLPEEQVEDIRAAALLHDIGKLEISRDLLHKAARLESSEIEEMRTHLPKAGDVLRPVGGTLGRILPIILSHHDKFDGTGYRPIKGEDIPIEARIISVADVYDALTSDRPYRKAMTPFEARDSMVKGAGADFDPDVIVAFETAFNMHLLEVPEVLV